MVVCSSESEGEGATEEARTGGTRSSPLWRPPSSRRQAVRSAERSRQAPLQVAWWLRYRPEDTGGEGKGRGQPAQAQGEFGHIARVYARARRSQSLNGRLRQAMALAFIRVSPYDIRPNLLLYVLEKDDEQLPKLFEYGCRYLAIMLARRGLAVPEEPIYIAVWDALAILQARKAPYNIKERGKELGLGSEAYGALRSVAVRVFTQRYREAFDRMQAAMLEEAA